MTKDTRTARELVDTTAVPGDEPWDELAGRVEKVLALPGLAIGAPHPKTDVEHGRLEMLLEVRRILNGEEP